MTRAKQWTPTEHETWIGRAYFRRNSLLPFVARFNMEPMHPSHGEWIFVDLDAREWFEHQERIWEQLLCQAWGLA